MLEVSFWEQDTFLAKYDVCIIGAGIVGLQAALYIKQANPGSRVGLVDRHSFPRGASVRNAGFACVGSLSELLADQEERGLEAVGALVEKRWKGLLALKTVVGESELGYTAYPGYEVFSPNQRASYEACVEAMDTFNPVFREITGIDQAFCIDSSSIQAHGLTGFTTMIQQKAEGQLHPGKLVKGLWDRAKAADIHFYGGLELLEWESNAKGVSLSFRQGMSLFARKVLCATNGYSRQFLPDLDLKPARNQVLMTTPIPGLSLRGSFHFHQGYVYFRNVGDRVLLGGGRHLDMLGETTDKHGENDAISQFLHDFLEIHLLSGIPYSIDHTWSGILGVGKAKDPIIEWVDPNFLVAVRLGGMGVAIGTLVGQEAGELLCQSF